MEMPSSGQLREALANNSEGASRCFFGWLAIAATILGLGAIAYRAIVETNYRTRLAEIERKSTAALHLFENDQPQALLMALDAGQQLQSLVHETADTLSPDNLRNGKLPLEQYPTLSPITTLDKILRQIQEQPIANPQQQMLDMDYIRWQGNEQILAAFDEEQRILAFWQADGTPIPVAGNTPHRQPSDIEWSRDRQIKVTNFSDVLNLWNLGRSPIASKRTGRVMGTAMVVRWSPDGQTLAIFGKRDGYVGLWNRDESVMTNLQAHPEEVLRLAWQKDSQTFITTGSDGIIKQWQRDGSPAATHILYQGSGTIIWGDGALWGDEDSPDFVIVDEAGTVQLWRGGQSPTVTISTDHAPQTIPRSLAWSPNGEKLAILTQDGTLQLWQRDGSLLATLKTDHTLDSMDDHLLWSPTSEQLAILSKDARPRPHQTQEEAAKEATVWLWSGQDTPITTIHQAQIFSMRWSPDSEILALSDNSGGLTLWSGDDASLLKRFDKNFEIILDVSWSKDGQLLFTRGRSAVRIWTHTGELIETMNYDISPVLSVNPRRVIWDEHQQILVIPNSSKREVMLWHQQKPAIAEFLTQQPLDLGTSWNPLDISWSPDDQTLATGGEDGTVKLWNRDGTLLKTIDAHGDTVWSISWRGDGQVLATGGADGTVKLWQPDGAPIRTIHLRKGDIPSEVAWSQDGERLIVASGRALPFVVGVNSFFSIWRADGSLVNTSFQEALRTDATEQEAQEYWQRDKERWQSFRDINLYQSNRLNVALPVADPHSWTEGNQATATCRSIFTCDTIEFIHGDNPPVNVPTAHVGSVNAMGWNPAGDILATASRADGLVKLWSRNGDLVTSFQAYDHGLERISWSSDGQTLATVNADGLVRLWPVRDLDSLLSQSCNWLNGYLIGKPDRLQDFPVCQTAERQPAAAKK